MYHYIYIYWLKSLILYGIWWIAYLCYLKHTLFSPSIFFCIFHCIIIPFGVFFKFWKLNLLLLVMSTWSSFSPYCLKRLAWYRQNLVLLDTFIVVLTVIIAEIVFINIFRLHTNLSHLSLSACPLITDQGFQCLTSKFRHLVPYKKVHILGDYGVWNVAKFKKYIFMW